MSGRRKRSTFVARRRGLASCPYRFASLIRDLGAWWMP